MAKIELEIGANVQDLLAGFEQMKKQMAEFDAKMKGTFEKMSKDGEDAAQSLSKAMTESMIKSATTIEKTAGSLDGLYDELKALETLAGQSTMPEAQKELQKQIDATKKKIQDLGGATRQFKDLTNMSLGEMRKYMRELRNISLVGMSPKQIAEVNGKIAELTDAMGDYRAMLAATGDKTQMVIESFQGLVGIAQGVTGTLTLFGVENEKLEKSMMALINLSMAMQTFHQMNETGLLKSTAAMIKNTTATVAQTLASNGYTMATTGATAATRLLGKVMVSVPFIAIAAAIAGVVVAVKNMVVAYKEAGAVVKLNNELQKASNANAASELTNLNNIAAKLRQNIGNKEKLNEVVNEWNNTYGKQYNASLNATTLNMDILADAIANVRKQIQMKALATAAEEKMTELIKDNTDEYLRYIDAQREVAVLRGKQLEYMSSGQWDKDMKAQFEAMARGEQDLGKYVINYEKLINEVYTAKNVNLDFAASLDKLTVLANSYTDVVDNNTHGIRDFANVTEDATNKTKELAMATATISDEQRIRENLDEAINYYDKLIALNINDYEKTKEYLDKKQQAIYEYYDALLSLEQNKAEQDGILTETERARIDELTAMRDKYVSDVETMNNEEVEGEEDKWRKLYDISKRVAGEAYAIYGKYIDDQISKLDEYVGRRTQVIGELESLLAAEVQLNEQGYASNIQLYQQRIEKEQQLRDEAMAQKEKYEKRKQAIETVSQAIDMSSAIAAMLKDAGVKFGVLAPIIGGAMIAALLMLFKKSKTQAAQTARFAKGGKGILHGASHSAGGVNLGEIGEGEGGEAYYILNKKATAKNRSLMDAVFDAVNGNRINLPLDAIASGGGTMTVELKEQAEIKEILKHMKSQKTTVYGNGFRDETFGNVRRRIWTN